MFPLWSKLFHEVLLCCRGLFASPVSCTGILHYSSPPLRAIFTHFFSESILLPSWVAPVNTNTAFYNSQFWSAFEFLACAAVPDHCWWYPSTKHLFVQRQQVLQPRTTWNWWFEKHLQILISFKNLSILVSFGYFLYFYLSFLFKGKILTHNVRSNKEQSKYFFHRALLYKCDYHTAFFQS